MTSDTLDLDAMHAEACKERDEAADLLFRAVLLLRCGQQPDDAFLERCRIVLDKRDDRREAAGLPRSVPKRTPDRRKSVQSEQPDQNRRSAVQPQRPAEFDRLGEVAHRVWTTMPKSADDMTYVEVPWKGLDEYHKSAWCHVADRVASIVRDKVRERSAKVCDDFADMMDSGAGGTAASRLRQAARNIRSQLSPTEMCPFGCGGPIHNATCAPMMDNAGFKFEPQGDIWAGPFHVKLDAARAILGGGSAPVSLGEVWSGETRGQFVGSVVEPGKSHCFKCGKEPKEHAFPIVCPGEADEVSRLRARIDEVQADGTRKHDAMVEAKNREAWRIYECEHWRTRAMLWRAALERAGLKPEEPKT